MVRDFFVLSVYAIIATVWMIYVTDAELPKIEQFMSGVGATGLGMLLMIALAGENETDP